MHITMNGTMLLATIGVMAGLGSFGIAIAKIRGKRQVRDTNGKLNTGRVMTLASDKIKEFWEGPCRAQRDNQEKLLIIHHDSYKSELKIERENQEKLLTIHQKMYRVELKASSDVLHGELESIKSVLVEGLGRIDKRIEEVNGAPDEG